MCRSWSRTSWRRASRARRGRRRRRRTSTREWPPSACDPSARPGEARQSSRGPRRNLRRPARPAGRCGGAGDRRGWIRSSILPSVRPSVRPRTHPTRPIRCSRHEPAPSEAAAPPVDAPPPIRAPLRCGTRSGSGRGTRRGTACGRPWTGARPASPSPVRPVRGIGPDRVRVPWPSRGRRSTRSHRAVQPIGQLLVRGLDGEEAGQVLLAGGVRVVDLGQPPVGTLDLVGRRAAG